MPIAEFNPDDFDQRNQNALDDSLLVKFEYRPKEDRTQTKIQGRPIFIDTLYVDIRTPGSKDYVCRPAKERDIKRFPRHYKAFVDRVEGKEDQIEGTLLTEWPLITRARVEELSFFNVKTVEQLAGMTDANSGQFMGINALKRKAQEWLVTAKDQNAAMHLATELKLRDEMIAEMKEEIEALKAKPKRKRRTKAQKAEDDAKEAEAQEEE